MPLNSIIKSITIFCFVSCFCISITFAKGSPNKQKLESVTLQLKWRHQFQFAGYYAAKHKGFFANEGLEVNFKEFNPDKSITQQVISGEVNYGVGDVGIVFDYATGKPIKALAAIFQHNPLVFISKQSSGIVSPYEMVGKRVMHITNESDDAPLKAILMDAELSSQDYTALKYSYDLTDFVSGKVDVISGYLTHEPLLLKEQGIDINIIKPQNYGVDFYGDLLFTSDLELNQHPGRAERFLRASIKGWEYAFEHPEEMIQIIKNVYHSQSSIVRLRKEAEEITKLVLPDQIPIGQLSVNRLLDVANVYHQLGLTESLNEEDLTQFIYLKENRVQLTEQELAWLQQNPRIRLAVDQNFAPYEWVDQEGQYQGMVSDYFELLEKKLSVQFEVINSFKTWEEALLAVKQGNADVLACIVKTPDRELYLAFSPPYLNSSAVIITEQSNGFVGSMRGLKGRIVAIQSGHYTAELLAKDYPEIHLVKTATIAEALQMVSEGIAFAYVGDVTSASYFMKKQGLLNLVFSGSTPYESQFSIATHKDQTVLFSALNKGLASITEEERNTIFN